MIVLDGQLDLLSWTPPPEKREPVRRGSTRGLKKDTRIRVRGTELRAADRGTVVEVLEHLTPPLVRYRSDRNGGIYDVRPELISLERKRRYRAPASTTPSEVE